MLKEALDILHSLFIKFIDVKYKDKESYLSEKS